MTTGSAAPTRIDRILGGIERAGNRIPEPFALFLGLFALLGVVSKNFVGFPPLGTVVTILLAVGLAQRSGLMSALIKVAFAGAPRWALPYAVAAVCMVGHVMADSVMIVIPPLAAMVFAAAGRHPVAGLLGAFAAAGAAYSTSFVVTSSTPCSPASPPR